jgi:hypothetical protein
MMTLTCAAMTLMLGAAVVERPVLIVAGDESPVRMGRATILASTEGPPVVLYAATNLTDQPLEQFTVLAFVFAADGTLKARQVAPGRRMLEKRETKYSTLVLDGSPIDPTDVIVIGINQAQRVDSDIWWRADLEDAAQAAVRRQKPSTAAK